MLWSLLKVLIFIAAIAGLTYGADFLIQADQGLRLQAAGWEFTLGPLQVVILVLLAVVALWLLMRIVGLLVATLRFLNGDETAISRYFDRDRERRGYQALHDGLVALAAGEGRLALIKAQRAAGYLNRPELTTLLIAQASEASGDGARATAAYKELLAHDETRFIGVRGLMKQKLAEGDLDTALALAEKAFALKPKHAETQDILLRLQSDKSDWSGARATLGAQAKSGALPKEVYRRRDAVLALQEARTILDDTQSVEAREAAIAAQKASPDLIPATVMAARALIAKGDTKTATRIVKKAWTGSAHPDLAAVFAEIEPEETPAQRLKRFKPLIDAHPGADESRLLSAELLIAAEDFPGARRALGDLVERHPTQRALVIMAAVERGEGSEDAVVRGWMARAMTAPRGPQWCCDKCQAIHAEWAPICSNCSGFDTLSWREPVEATGKSATGAEMLPLIVSPPARPAKPVEKETEIIDLADIARRGD
jgi:HemY protein